MYGMYGLIARNDWMDVRSVEVDDTSMKRMDNVVELATTHLHQSAIAETEIGKQPVAAVAEVARGAVKGRQKKRKGNRILAGGVAQHKGYPCRPSPHSFSLSPSKSKSTPHLHLLHELSLVSAYGRGCVVTVGE
jgi:hypothetical protein